MTSSKATATSDKTELTFLDDTTTNEKTKKKLDNFIKLFFTNYTSNQENLDLLANNLLALENTTFKTLDYSYYQEKGKETMAYVQVTFEVAGNTHSENFTLTLKDKDKSYFVKNLKHTITTNYTETGDTK
ncbi:conjugal transfer protein [Streptococcus iniae]